MLDSYNRNINYLRISVTDRCNLRCRYCMPAEGIEWIDHSHILSFEEIIEVAEEAVSLGVDKIRLTGGEPLVRKGIVDLVKMIASIPGVKDLGMTTNGQLLEKYAFPLAEAGLNRVNVSLDTLDAKNYKYLSRGGNIKKVFKGLEAARNAGLDPIKINCVINPSGDRNERQELIDFCNENNYKLRFIRQMSLEDGSFYPVEGGEGGICKICNRIRLTANGDIKPCLFSEDGFNVREYGARNAILKAVGAKPLSGKKNKVNQFYNIVG
ncbi:MAG: radical SAM protein [Marinilabiliales bacterium]|nr:MAG: radical SAM protein [Marinilabiliales bacterium]